MGGIPGARRQDRQAHGERQANAGRRRPQGHRGTSSTTRATSATARGSSPNRRYVDEKTGGRVGYIYVPDTGVDGQNDLVPAVLGQIAQGRRSSSTSDGTAAARSPRASSSCSNRPIDQLLGSARRQGLALAAGLPPGPQVHAHQRRWPGPAATTSRTSSGSAGSASSSACAPGAGWSASAATPASSTARSSRCRRSRFYEPDGTWGIEGHGVDPDIEVIDDPALMVGGRDPQLDAGIAQMLDELQRRPYSPPPKPAYPDRSGMGLLLQDR